MSILEVLKVIRGKRTNLYETSRTTKIQNVKRNFTELAKKYNMRDQSGINILAHEIEVKLVSN